MSSGISEDLKIKRNQGRLQYSVDLLHSNSLLRRHLSIRSPNSTLMSTSGDIHLDLQVIAGLLGTEDLNPPSSKPANQNHSILGDNTNQPTK